MGVSLVTGGSGYFGTCLIKHLKSKGERLVNVDVLEPDPSTPQDAFYRVDITDSKKLEKIFKDERVDTVYNCAAKLAHTQTSEKELFRVNLDGTASVYEACLKSNIKALVHISTNCLWCDGQSTEVDENHPTAPREAYGHSKLAAEKFLHQQNESALNVAIIRTPTIMGENRLGLISILFDFVNEGRNLWVLGNGENRYQFVWDQDLAEAVYLLGSKKLSGIYHVGSDNVPTLNKLYSSLIEYASSSSKIVHLPAAPLRIFLKILHMVGLSPLGAYQQRMLSESFVFNTKKLRETTGWQPRRNNIDVICEAYAGFQKNMLKKSTLELSPHKSKAKMGILKLVKWLS